MLFSSEVFLFLFLPLVLAAHWAARTTAQRNLVLLVASLGFYAWGEGSFVLLLVAFAGVNWGLGLAASTERRALAVIAAVVWNIGLLGVVKYSGFALESASAVSTWLGGRALPAIQLALPLGISFFSFQGLSYVIDVARRDVRALRSPSDFLLFKAFFPQLIAGPIVRYDQVADALEGRSFELTRFASGARRFVLGLAKKVLVANVVARPADDIFGLPPAELSCGVAWLGALCYALQIYFDFSGYSDMAMGLGRMFGFELPENFRHPYAARSITDFWRRWHMTLSTWFRDYVYIPLGGGRVSRPRVYRNLVVVFLLCGLWHGAAWTFVVWGLWHGALLIAERAGLEARLARLPGVVGHGWVVVTVLIGWVVFRAGSLGHAAQLLAAMAGLAPGPGLPLGRFADAVVVAALLAGVVGSLPLVPALERRMAERPGAAWSLGRGLGLALLLLASATLIVAGTHDPFIYFRF